MGNRLLHYFTLGLLEREPTLGTGKKKPPVWPQVLLMLVMYLGVLLGVIAEYLLETLKAAGPTGPLGNVAFGLFKAWLIATLLFPLVFPRVFGPMDASMVLAGADAKVPSRVLQFFVAFQNGFFWQAVLFR
ncbi:MAG: hypothetical protein NT169_21435 [Chloroflexi bacterium]|nr:hypothetical protein [Chloroflexota bacterium]